MAELGEWLFEPYEFEFMRRALASLLIMHLVKSRNHRLVRLSPRLVPLNKKLMLVQQDVSASASAKAILGQYWPL